MENVLSSDLTLQLCSHCCFRILSNNVNVIELFSLRVELSKCCCIRVLLWYPRWQLKGQLDCLLFAAEEVIKQIEEFDGLEALRLEGNTVGVEAAKVIAKALEKKSELKVRCSSGWRWRGKSNVEILKAYLCSSCGSVLWVSLVGKNNHMKMAELGDFRIMGTLSAFLTVPVQEASSL